MQPNFLPPSDPHDLASGVNTSSSSQATQPPPVQPQGVLAEAAALGRMSPLSGLQFTRDGDDVPSRLTSSDLSSRDGAKENPSVQTSSSCTTARDKL